MPTRPVVLVAFEDQDNLGVGYIASVLLRAGLAVRVLDFRLGAAAILRELAGEEPLVVGFSVIFQFHIDGFRELMTSLRQGGLACHFTAGGHYPSLRPDDLLGLIPELDSVVLFDGELTMLELARRLAAGGDWRSIQGLAYRAGEGVVTTSLRPLERDLDVFPPPVRQPLREFAYGQKFATLLAGRGCVNHCAFCSIREFYRASGGPIKRVRRPERVVREMELLHQQLGCSVFMFQDDDFPVTYAKGSWLGAFCDLLVEKGLAGKVLWKMNCRVDELTRESVAYMRDHGLFLVYLGIESGTDDGLARMGKRTTAADNLRAAEVLKDLDVLFDYGFMLFDPDSTFESVRLDLDFLDTLGGDGSTPVTFCKMLPLAGTIVERRLAASGRLIGPPGNVDYAFDDPRLDRLSALMDRSFADWIGQPSGLLNLGRWARHFLGVYSRTEGPSREHDAAAVSVRAIIRDSNRAFTDLARRMADHSEREGGVEAASALQNEAQVTHTRYRAELDALMPAITGLPVGQCVGVPQDSPSASRSSSDGACLTRLGRERLTPSTEAHPI